MYIKFNLVDEDDHVNTIRLDMIRNNEKYMKELHKKYE